MSEKNYLSRKSRLLRDFDKSIAHARSTLTAHFGWEDSNELVSESRQEYETLVPHIPYIGDRSPLLFFLLPTTRYLGVHRALLKRGASLEVIGQVCVEMGVGEIKALPGFVHRAIGFLWFSPWFINRLRRRAARSKERKYPGGYVIDFIRGDGESFDYGIDYLECASCKFLTAQGAPELTPYACAVDKAASELLGWGLSRTMTLAEGYDKCDFRFKQGGDTNVPIPQHLIPDNR